MKNLKKSDNSLHNVIKIKDEEKAINELCKKCSSFDFCNKNNQLHCAETVAYIKGLAEGRKEKEELIGMFINVDLEKENAELKERLKSEANEIIKDLLYCTDGIAVVSIPEENRFLSVKKLKARAEKFLKE